MEQLDLRTWKEKLDEMIVKDTLPVDNEQSVYSAIRSNPITFKDREFSVRTDRTTGQKHVMRIK